ncbi:polysaccharide biosynthesis C-terminal domain-containing protein [Roseibacillus persicicus]|uniref:lipopolysaccharide biosynthesis protein n=1 Tax=Roseibacillus persicicus TaxID=454148 RepID=UPI00398BA206
MKKIWKTLVASIVSISPQLVTAAVLVSVFRLFSIYLDGESVGKIMLIIGGLSLIESIFVSPICQSFYYLADKNNVLDSFLSLIERLGMGKGAYRFVLFIPVLLVIFYSILGPEVRWILLILALGLFCWARLQKSLFLAYFNLDDKVLSYAALLIVDSLFYFFGLLFTLKFIGGIEGALFGILLSVVASSVFCWIVYLSTVRDTNSPWKVDETTISLASYFSHSRPIAVMGIIGWCTNFLDRYIVGITLGYEKAGVYSMVSGLVARPYNVLGSGLSVRFKPLIFRDIKNQLSPMRNWIIQAVSLGFLGVIGILMIRGPIIEIVFAGRYEDEALILLPIFGIVYLLSILFHPFDNIFMSQGRNRDLLRFQLLQSILSAFILLFGGLSFGVYGAAASRIFSLSIGMVLLYYFWRRLLSKISSDRALSVEKCKL